MIELKNCKTMFKVFLNEYNVLPTCLPQLCDFAEEYENPLPIGRIHECFQVKQSPAQPLYKTTEYNK